MTGGNTGLGKEIVRQLARRGAVVYMASRTESRARTAIDELLAEHPEIIEKGGRIEFLHLDLCNLKNCQSAARTFLEKEKRLDILSAFPVSDSLLDWTDRDLQLTMLVLWLRQLR